ncbi:Pr6Pr family membrane protein [Tabrizicola sp.]|uniref:Pr6Pr family membrane protein n=1 Tax=Tabrizicola sp. TaxID=2005166 RepID=UPI003F31371E
MTIRRLSALALALIAIGSISLQFALNGATPGLEPWGLRAWDLLRYFTILTCILVAVLMACEAAGRPVSGNWLAAATLSIVMVGMIFQILLAPPEPPKGIHWWPDFGFHAAIPVLTAVWWGLWAPKPLSLRMLPLWLLWPVAYCIYGLVRGAVEGRYPYFFLDINRFGVTQIAINIVGLVLVFAGCGLTIWYAARILSRSAV